MPLLQKNSTAAEDNPNTPAGPGVTWVDVIEAAGGDRRHRCPYRRRVHQRFSDENDELDRFFGL